MRFSNQIFGLHQNILLSQLESFRLVFFFYKLVFFGSEVINQFLRIV